MHRLVVAVLFLVAACGSPPSPYELAYTVFPTVDGADIAVRVAGGATRQAWVAFGVGPGVPIERVDRVHSLAAWRADGTQLPVTAYRDGAYRIDEMNGGSWTLTYSLDLRVRDEDDVFYRSSVREDDYLVLVGSDAFARFGTDPSMVLPPPDDRPSGPLSRASVTFYLPDDDPSWRVVTTAPSVTPSSFELGEHPVGSVFAVAPMTSAMLEGATALRLARHRDWRVLPDGIEPMLASLQRSLAERIGALPGAAVALLLPLPQNLRQSTGLRTSGMVRGDTVLLYADAAAVRPETIDGIRAAMAVFLGHELFHLYVPTTLAVGRELSWLSEGWAMHMGRIAAIDGGWLTADTAEARVAQTYRRYLDLGGYRAGSLPEASMGSESQRDLLYLRGELVFRLLDRSWRERHSGSFEPELWSRLTRAYDGEHPLESEQVEGVLAELFDPATVRRYVAGRAPLTQGALGLDH